jgi:D-glycero-D-manno-heptose 1,7-bisphosphate phosphatase
MAHKVGARGILVLTGYGRGEYEYQQNDWEREPDFIAEDLLRAVQWILTERKIQKIR